MPNLSITLFFSSLFFLYLGQNLFRRDAGLSNKIDTATLGGCVLMGLGLSGLISVAWVTPLEPLQAQVAGLPLIPKILAGFLAVLGVGGLGYRPFQWLRTPWRVFADGRQVELLPPGTCFRADVNMMGTLPMNVAVSPQGLGLAIRGIWGIGATTVFLPWSHLTTVRTHENSAIVGTIDGWEIVVYGAAGTVLLERVRAVRARKVA